MQTFPYDALNRLLQAKETVNGQQNWLQTFTYDRYGNRTGFAQNVGGQQLSIDSNTLPDVEAATNRFESGQGYEYDYSGNLITDPQNRHFSFNADNKQVEVRDASNVLIGQYFYDAGGKRVKKIAGNETTIFVYDGMGKQIAEYSTTAVSNPTTSYVMTDTLQSVRAVSDAQGKVISRRDFLPFGEELYAGTPIALPPKAIPPSARITSGSDLPGMRKTWKPVSISPRPVTITTNTGGSRRLIHYWLVGNQRTHRHLTDTRT